MALAVNYRYPLAGLDPAAHVFLFTLCGRRKTWMAGSSPARGFYEAKLNANSPNNTARELNRTAVSLTRGPRGAQGDAHGQVRGLKAHGSSPAMTNRRALPPDRIPAYISLRR